MDTSSNLKDEPIMDIVNKVYTLSYKTYKAKGHSTHWRKYTTHGPSLRVSFSATPEGFLNTCEMLQLLVAQQVIFKRFSV